MKKVFLLALLAAVCLCFAACNNNTATVDQKWASEETLTYSVYDSGNKTKTAILVGEAKFETTTKLTAEDRQACADADTKVVSTFTIGNVVTTTTYYARIYSVKKLTRTVVNADDPKENYTVTGEHDGKNFEYSIRYPNDPQRDGSGKINVGKDKYSDFEFLYFFLRCYEPSSMPSGVHVPDVFTNESVKLNCSLVSSSATVKTESDLGTVTANQVSIQRADSPVGAPSYVYYLPESQLSVGEGSMVKSSCFPVRIEENNVAFVLKDYSPKK